MCHLHVALETISYNCKLYLQQTVRRQWFYALVISCVHDMLTEEVSNGAREETIKSTKGKSSSTCVYNSFTSYIITILTQVYQKCLKQLEKVSQVL